MKKARLINASLVLAAICLSAAEGVWAQKWASVYDASTDSVETPEVKTLNADDFSAYAVEICKKYEIEGPKQVNGPNDQTELFQKLSEFRKLLFTRLCDPEVRKNAPLKEKLQLQMKDLTEDIRVFPELEGFGKVDMPSSHKEKTFREIPLADFAKKSPPRQPKPVTKSVPLKKK